MVDLAIPPPSPLVRCSLTADTSAALEDLKGEGGSDRPRRPSTGAARCLHFSAQFSLPMEWEKEEEERVSEIKSEKDVLVGPTLGNLHCAVCS